MEEEYEYIQDGNSQARLLYYRSLVYEATQEKQSALVDVEVALFIAQQLSLPFVDFLQERLDKLRANSV